MRRMMALLTLAAVAGCAGGSKQPPLPEGDWEVTVISQGDTVSVPAGSEGPVGAAPDRRSEPGASVPAAEAEAASDSLPDKPLPPRDRLADNEPPALGERDYTYGYRIQVLAASSMIQAEQEAARADSLLALPQYVEYEPPFYKVRLGNFLLKEDAESVLAREVREHYEHAWVVQTLVLRPR